MTLSRRKETDERAEQILAGALRGKGGALTKSDAIALTGLSAPETDGALRSLMHRYKSHLAVTETGELLYKFDPSMQRRDAVTLAERLRQIGEMTWRAFTFLFKISIAVTMVVYVVAFVAMILAMIFARSASDRDDRRDSRGGGIDPWLIYWLMPDWAPRGYYRSQPRGLGGGVRKPPTKRFYQSVFDYVFGPKPPSADKLAAEKEVVSYIRDHDGRITATDLVALTGWSYERAEEEATRLLVDFDGEPDIADDGTLVYVFPELRKTAGEMGSGGWDYTWRRQRALPPLTGNTSGTNTAITVMNGFNLLSGFTVFPMFLMKFHLAVSASMMFFGQTFPAIFSSVFFAVPAARAIKQSRARKRLLDETARALLVGEIIERRGVAVRPEELVAAVGRKGIEAPRAKKVLDKLLADLDGDVGNDEAGNVTYLFPRINSEQIAVDKARRLAPSAEREAGQVVFSSDAEGSGELDALPSSPDRRRLQ